MQYCALLLIVCALVGALVAPLRADPLLHTCKTYRGECRVNMPQMPQRMTQIVSRPEERLDMEYESYLAEDSAGQVYLLMIAGYAQGIDAIRPDANLEGFLNGMVGFHEGNRLSKAWFEAVAGRRGMGFIMENGDRRFCGHVLISGQKVYLLALESPLSLPQSEYYDKFLSSFEWL